MDSPKAENKIIQLEQQLANISRVEVCIAAAPPCKIINEYFIGHDMI